MPQPSSMMRAVLLVMAARRYPSPRLLPPPCSPHANKGSGTRFGPLEPSSSGRETRSAPMRNRSIAITHSTEANWHHVGMHPLGPPDVVHHDPPPGLQSRGQLRPLRSNAGLRGAHRGTPDRSGGSEARSGQSVSSNGPPGVPHRPRAPCCSSVGLGQCGQDRTSFEPHIPASIAGPERHAHGPSPQAGPQLEDVDWTIGPSCAFTD